MDMKYKQASHRLQICATSCMNFPNNTEHKKPDTKNTYCIISFI